MIMELYDYQKDILNETCNLFKTKDRILLQLATSGGKTFVFSNLTKYWTKKNGCRVLILCHREELVFQAIAEMNKLGVTCEAVMPKNKTLKHTCDCYVGMIETVHRRLLKNPYFFNNVGLVIADECHVQIFEKSYSYFPDAKILGVTATPVVMKRLKFWKCKHCKTEFKEPTECCDEVSDEWSKPFTLSLIYEDIIVGPPIDKLIEKGSLVKDISFVKHYVDESALQTGADGEFTTESLDAVYSNDDAAFNCLKNYKELCTGKKTIIFNSSTKNNLMVYEKFKEEGLNVRMYDSVNKEQSGNRKELVEWFNREDDSILMNCGCFIAGFNSKEVQAIILNVATNSLSQFIQMCGRGARATDVIYKDHFILIDGGGNIDRHQEFSDPTRDWKNIFFNGVGVPKPKKQEALDIQSCMGCGALHLKNVLECPECGYVQLPEDKPEQGKLKLLSEEILMPIRKIPPPDGKHIYDYTVKKQENINFAFKIMINQILDLFRYYRVTKSMYENALQSGKLEKRVRQITHKCYFFLLSKKDIQADNNRTIDYLINKVLNNLEKYYGGC